MTTAWAHLPNAKHIDRVLDSLRANPGKWRAAKFSATVRLAAWSAAWSADRDADRDAARDAAWDAAWDADWDADRDAAWPAILALIAYDDCAHMLGSDVGELKILAAFGDPRAILLLPACAVFSEIYSTKESEKC